jgi:sigma-E factor negative regulatory protein RseA
MNDDLNLKLSLFLDDELAKDESVNLLELVQQQPELKTRLQRYELVSNVIKSENFIHAEPDFVSKVSQSIKQEAVVFAPAWRQRKSGFQTLSAIAASVAIIAIIAFGGISLTPETSPPPSTVAANNKAVKEKITLAVAEEKLVIKDKPIITAAINDEKTNVDPRFIEYLAAHDNSLYAAGSPGLQSYARVVSNGQR